MQRKCFVEMLFKHYREMRMHSKKLFCLMYKHTLHWFIDITNNQKSPPTHFCFCWTRGREINHILMMAMAHIIYVTNSHWLFLWRHYIYGEQIGSKSLATIITRYYIFKADIQETKWLTGHYAFCWTLLSRGKPMDNKAIAAWWAVDELWTTCLYIILCWLKLATTMQMISRLTVTK